MTTTRNLFGDSFLFHKLSALMPHTLAGQNSQQMAANYNIPSDSEDSEEDYFSAEEDINYENGNILK